MSLAEKLAALRKQKGLTQMELAAYLSVSRQAISRWEVGASVPSTDNLRVLAELYGVTVDYLLNGGTAEVPNQTETEPVPERKAKAPRWNVYTTIIAVCVLIIAVLTAIIIRMATVRKWEEAPTVPIDEMATVIEDGYPVATFIID